MQPPSIHSIDRSIPPHIFRTNPKENIYKTYFQLTDYFHAQFADECSGSSSASSSTPETETEPPPHPHHRVLVLMEVGAFFEMYAILPDTDASAHRKHGGHGTLSDTELEQCIGSEIAFMSRVCDLQVSPHSKSTYNGKKIVFAGFKNHLIDKYLSLLCANQCIVVLYEQDVNESADAKPSDGKPRIFSGIYSSGTHFTTFTSDTSASESASASSVLATTTNKSTCIWVDICKPLRFGVGKGTARTQERIYIGIACVDIFTGTVVCNEYTRAFTNVPATFDEILNHMAVHQPSEVLFVANTSREQIQKWCTWCNISASAKRIVLVPLASTSASASDSSSTQPKNEERARKCEKQSYQYELLRTFYNVNDPDAFRNQFAEYTYLTQSLCFLLDHLHQHNPYLVHRLSPPLLNSEHSHLVLANHSLRQLHIIEDLNRDAPSSRHSCVLNWLNICITPMGKRAFAHRLLHPTTKPEWLEDEYAIQAHWHDLWHRLHGEKGAFWKQCAQSLQSIKDTEKMYRQCVMRKVSPRTIYQLHTCISTTRQWMQFLYSEWTPEERDTTVAHLAKRGVDWHRLLHELDAIMEFMDTSFHIENCKWVDRLSKDIEKCGGKNYIRAGVRPELDSAVHSFGVASIHLESYRRYFDDQLRFLSVSATASRKKSSRATSSSVNSTTTQYVHIHRTDKNEVSIVSTPTRCTSLMQHLRAHSASTYNMVDIPISYTSLRAGAPTEIEEPKNTNANTNTKQETQQENANEMEEDGTTVDADADADEEWMDECEWNLLVSKLPTTIPLPISSLELSKRTSASVAITCPDILSTCKQWKTAKQKMMTEMVTAFYKLIDVLQQYQSTLQHMNAFLTTMDVLLCNVRMAVRHQYCRPTLDLSADKSFVDVTALRHVLIEQLQHNELYVANSIVLGACPHSSSTSTATTPSTMPSTSDSSAVAGVCQDGVLLFGSNAVGKTSFIRAVGIAVIMAQAGLYVPAQSFRFKPYTALYTRILGNDDLHRGFSTFVVEMHELRAILTNGDANSLVLGDELCSGTDTTSAVSIFMSALMTQCEKKMSFMYATHLREIVALEELKQMRTVVCKHMEVVYNAELGCLVYNRVLRDGVGNAHSQGLEVCKSMSMPSAFIDQAVEIRNRYYGGYVDGKGGSVLDAPVSRYCAQKVRTVCEMCNAEMAEEVHHLQFQQNANQDGVIVREGEAPFHKNAKANLMNVCEKCHNTIHSSGREYRRVKTLEHGYRILPVANHQK